MTTQMISHQSHSTIARRPAIDIVIERVARGLLAWSDRRAQKSLFSHARMELLRANESGAPHGGSSIAR